MKAKEIMLLAMGMCYVSVLSSRLLLMTVSALIFIDCVSGWKSKLILAFLPLYRYVHVTYGYWSIGNPIHMNIGSMVLIAVYSTMFFLIRKRVKASVNIL